LKRFIASVVFVMLVCAAVVLSVSGFVYMRSRAQIEDARSPGFSVSSGHAMTLPAPTLDDDSAPGPRVRVAVIGGMFETGFWSALSQRYLQQTGVHIKLISTGPKGVIEHAFKSTAAVDLITMHASDTIINLVADGYCVDAEPWMRNDQVIVGPAEDPARIRGMTDAAAALAKIAACHAPFVVHSSLGTQEVLRGILEDNDIQLDEKYLTLLFLDNQRNVLHIASQRKAYTLVGRIPFRDGKLSNEGLVVMVSGDARLRRPYMVAVANPERFPDVHFEEAEKLAHWMRSRETQAWIAEYGRGQLDDQPLFFPVEVPSVMSKTPATEPSH